MSFEGRLSDPRLNAKIDVTGLGNSEQKLGDINFLANYYRRKASVKLLAEVSDKNKATIVLNATPDLSLKALQNKTVLTPQSTFDLDARVAIADLSIFTPFIPNLKSMGGTLAADVRGSGKIQKPDVEGRVELSNSLLSINGVRTVRVDNLVAVLANNTLSLNQLDIRSGGELSLVGRVNNVLSENKSFNFDLTSRALMIEPARYPSDTLDAKVKIEGEITPELLQSNIRIENARVWVPKLAAPKPVQSLKSNPDVVIVDRNTIAVEEKKSQEQQPKSRRIAIRVDAPRNLFIQGPELLLEFGTRLAVDVEENETKIDGYLSTVRPGQVNFLGRQIRIDDTRIQFRQTDPKAAELSVDASYPTSEALVLVEVRGTLGEPTVALKSDPPLPEFKIASLLLGGESGNQAAGGESSLQDKSSTVAANAIGSLVTSQLESALFPRSPVTLSARVDDPNEKKGDVAVGKYINPNLFVSYERRFGSEIEENTNQVRFDYRLANRWSLEGFFGDAQEGGVDIFWKRPF